MKRLFFLLLLLLPSGIHAQVISTIAGNGFIGYSGDGGAATSAQLTFAYGIAVDKAGNVFFSDNGSPSVVRKINASGIITNFAGIGTGGYSGDGGPATLAMIKNPHGICFDKVGNLYVIDSTARIRKVDTSGIITTFAGIGGTGGFGGDGGPATAAMLHSPSNIASDTLGNIYIGDGLNYRIRKVDAAGIITTVAGTGLTGYSGDGGPATDAQIATSGGIAADRRGNLYIADGNARVRKVDPFGIITTFAGNGTIGFSGDGGPATSALIAKTFFVTTDKPGNVYIADYLNYRIRKIDTSSIITTIGGTGTSGYSDDYCSATNAQISLVPCIAVDSNGVVYFTDLSNRRVRKIGHSHAPLFSGGHSQGLTVCADSGNVSVDTLLAVIDADYGQGEIWSVLHLPGHGTLTASDTTVSTGGILTPAGLSYLPATGYTGSDTFRVIITDCAGLSDTTAVYITVSACGGSDLNVAGVDNHSAYYINPNPVSTLLSITATGKINHISISNLLGQTVYNHGYNAAKVQVDVAAFPKGVYFIKINDSEIRKFVKE